MRIWKFPLLITDRQTISMPGPGTIIAVQAQDDEPMLWAMCDVAAELIERHIAIYGTGQPLPADPGRYIATFQDHSRAVPFVWHVFECPARDLPY